MDEQKKRYTVDMLCLQTAPHFHFVLGEIPEADGSRRFRPFCIFKSTHTGRGKVIVRAPTVNHSPTLCMPHCEMGDGTETTMTSCAVAATDATAAVAVAVVGETEERVTLKAAMLACWPDETNPKSAVQAIKAGEVERHRGSRDGSGGYDDAVFLWKVERHYGKRNVKSDDLLRWRGEIRELPSLPLFVMMHKPAGYVTTTIERGLVPNEQNGTKTVYDLLQHAHKRHLRAVGRLDKNTEGLLLFTTQGRWIGPLTAPGSGTTKCYRCWLEQPASTRDLELWVRGDVQFRDRRSPGGWATARPALAAHVVRDDDDINDFTCVDVTISEGRYRQVRRCWESLRSNRVVRLQRISFGPIPLGSLPLGQCRELDATEVEALRQCVTASTTQKQNSVEPILMER